MQEVTKYLSKNGQLYDSAAEALMHDTDYTEEYLVQYCILLKDVCENSLAPDCKICKIANEYKKYGTFMRN